MPLPSSCLEYHRMRLDLCLGLSSDHLLSTDNRESEGDK